MPRHLSVTYFLNGLRYTCKCSSAAYLTQLASDFAEMDTLVGMLQVFEETDVGKLATGIFYRLEDPAPPLSELHTTGRAIYLVSFSGNA